jgi:hypothetical protein
VVVGFALADSDLPLQAAFPILMRDLVNLLRPDAALGLPAQVDPLASLRISVVDETITDVLVEDPSGHEWALRADPSGVTFAETEQTGTYYVSQYAGDKLAWQGAFAVNLFSRDESILPSNARALAALEAFSAPSGIESTAEASRNEIWPTFAVLGIVLLLLEWAYANRIAIRRAVTEARARRQVGA